MYNLTYCYCYYNERIVDQAVVKIVYTLIVLLQEKRENQNNNTCRQSLMMSKYQKPRIFTTTSTTFRTIITGMFFIIVSISMYFSLHLVFTFTCNYYHYKKNGKVMYLLCKNFKNWRQNEPTWLLFKKISDCARCHSWSYIESTWV